jgi:hypothetical protein
MEVKGTAVVVNAVDAVVVGLPGPLAGENVDFVLAALQRGSQFGHVDADAADGDGMEGLPGKQSDAHAYLLLQNGGASWQLARTDKLPTCPHRPRHFRTFKEFTTLPANHVASSNAE